MVKKSPRLDEFIGREYLQHLQDIIAQAADITAVILVPPGVPVTRMSNPRGFCELGANSEKHRKICNKTHEQLLRQARRTKKTVTGICPHSGLSGAAVPFFLGNTFVGAWIVSQIRIDDGNEVPFAGGAPEQDKAQSVVEAIPARGRSEFELILNFLSILTEEIVQMASGKANLAKKNEELLALTQRLAYSENSFKVLFNTSTMGIYIRDFHTSEIILCNNTHAGYFDMKPEEVIGRRCYELLGINSYCEDCPCDRGDFSGKHQFRSHTQECYVKIKNDEYWFQTTFQVTQWIDGRIVYIITYVNVTDRRRVEEKLNFLAFWDRGMQIPNLARMERDITGNTLYECLIMLNIRGLKKINSIYGRDCGDALLMAVRDYIYQLRISESSLYRMEDADFGILLKKTSGGELVRQVAENIRKRCEKSWEIIGKGHRYNIFIDVNVCIIPLSQAQRNLFSNLYAAMDHTLEVARAGDGVAVYDDKTYEKFQAKQRMELVLRNAVHENMRGFSVVYQPVVTSNIFIWNAVEALCRWDPVELGKVTPNEFIPLAERSGVIGVIGMWVLEQAIIQVRKWGLDKLDDFFLEVNLSPVQINEPNLAKNIEEILKKHQYPPQKLCLEITESSEMIFSKYTVAVIERLNELGIVIALDDFGTGYTSFKMLYEMPVKVLKTDRTLIEGVDNNEQLQRMFYVMVELARILDMRIVAEGVEKNSQVQYLLKQGVDFFQGFFFSPPLTSEEMEKKLDNFYKPADILMSQGYHKLDLTSLGDKQGGHDLNPKMYKILNKCMREMFFSDAEGDEAINIALTNIGEGMGVSRAYLFLKEDDGTYSSTHEWCAAGIEPVKDVLQRMPFTERFPFWIESLDKQGFFVVEDIRVLEKDFCKFFESFGVRAIVNLPIRKQGKLCGFVGFNHHQGRRNWALEDVQMLHTLTGIIVSVLGRVWLRDEVAVQNNMREIILNNINAFIYVSDMDTDKILFANAKLRELHGGEKLIGRPCWEVLQQRSEKCPTCPKGKLLKNPEKRYRWEFYNKNLERYFKVWDILIPWMDNKPAHLEFAEDITELKAYKNKLAALDAIE